jgi:hypothetical protein
MFGIRAYLNNATHCYTNDKIGKIHKGYTRPSMLSTFSVVIILVDND